MANPALIIPAVFGTATLSGVFGMGGGMILMGIFAMTLPLATAMILHGVTQLGANGFRALLFRRHIRASIVARVGVGAVIALGLLTWLQFSVEPRVVFLLLGAVPLLVLAMPASVRLTIESPLQAVGCGLVFTAVQLVAGASGPLLDAFFLRGRLDRFEIIATKAAISSLGHILKLLYWTLLLRSAAAVDLPPWILATVIVVAFAGTRAGKAILAALSEGQFRRYSTALVVVIAALYLARGIF